MTRELALGLLLAVYPGAADADGIMLVQAGAFWMGSDTDDPNEAPLHRVYVRDFWIDRHKVTNAEFVRFLNVRGAKSSEGEDYFDWDDADVRMHGPGRGPAGAVSDVRGRIRGRGGRRGTRSRPAPGSPAGTATATAVPPPSGRPSTRCR